jgi:tartrate dehydrogenase/decarboxylase/D-malate dehydrogenase
MNVSVFTRTGVERIHRFAFDLARSRPRKLLTMVTKFNAQRHGMVMWDEVFEDIKGDYPDVKSDKMLVDAMTTRMVLDPKSLDTIVATNLHTDILSDLAAGLSGSMGIAPTTNLRPEKDLPSMFEPIHGSAFNIMGQGIAKPYRGILVRIIDVRTPGRNFRRHTLMNSIERVTGAGEVLP